MLGTASEETTAAVSAEAEGGREDAVVEEAAASLGAQPDRSPTRRSSMSSFLTFTIKGLLLRVKAERLVKYLPLIALSNYGFHLMVYPMLLEVELLDREVLSLKALLICPLLRIYAPYSRLFPSQYVL